MPKREVILNAALGLFLQQGYERTSLRQIVSITGGSLATVYKLFGNKSQLFFEVIKHQQTSSLRALKTVLESSANLPLAEQLELFARGFLRFLCDEENIMILRLIITRIYVDDELSARVQSEQTRPAVSYLTELFAARKECANCDAKALAQLFLGLLKSAEFGEILWLDKRPSEAQIDAHAKFVSEFFMNALAAYQ